MWVITLRSPDGEPREFILKTGKTSLGRKSDNDVVISDDSASRYHAEFYYDPTANLVTLRDLNSTNGTFINRERIQQPRVLRPEDQVRIGQHVINLSVREQDQRLGTDKLPVTQPLTRELLLESVDQHAVLLYEAAQRLNTILDSDTALAEVARLMRTAMGAEKCEVIMAAQFDRLADLGFPTTFARQAIDQRMAVVVPNLDELGGQSAVLLRVRSALVVPILIGEEVSGVIYVYKTNPEARPFTQTDLQLAVAISHQAALTVQRTRLLRRVRQSDRISQLFRRFFSPNEADRVLSEYQRSGQLPGLSEQVLTVMFVDIRDSTGMAERLGARRFGDILARYYQEMTEIIFANEGLVNAYMGDGILAVYGALGRPEPEIRAVRTAVQMLGRIATMNETGLGEPLVVAIGINTGPMMAGYVGTEERVEYTVLGEEVNIAQRLEHHAHSNRIFVGPGTHAAVARAFRTRAIGPVDFRGITKPIHVHEVLRD